MSLISVTYMYILTIQYANTCIHTNPETIMKQCTPLGSRSLPDVPTAELNNLKEILFRHSPRFWGNTAELESMWSDCIKSIGQACKRLRTCK